MVEHVLVPVDGSPQSADAVAFTVSEWPDAELTLLHVIDPVEGGFSMEAVREGAEGWHKERKLEAHALLDDLRESTDGRAAARIETGRPARTVLDVLDEGAFDHVVLGSHGRSGVSRVLLGSVAEDVLRESPVPVTVVRRWNEGDVDPEDVNGDPGSAGTVDDADADERTG